MTHEAVLKEAAVDALNVRDDGIYVDATFGRGGHSRLILKRLGPSGRLIALDVDPEAIAHGRRAFAGEPRLTLFARNFRELGALLRDCAVFGTVDGLLMDLGVSSPQLDDPARGFSFRHDGPLDMRLGPDAPRTAAQWLADVGEAELAEVLRDYGEERHARRIARAIVEARARSAMSRTASNSSRWTTSISRRIRSVWLRNTVCASVLRPWAAPAASVISLANSSSSRF